MAWQRLQANTAHICVGKRFPQHVMIGAGRPVAGNYRGHFRQWESEAVMKVIKSDFPCGLHSKFQVFRNGCVVGRKVLRLKLQRRHH